MNVSMQRLADALSLSPGNLTYHFPKKEDLMIALYDTFQAEILRVIPEADKNIATLSGLDDQITQFYGLQQRFLFLYLDLLEIERSYHKIAQRHYAHIENQITSIKYALQYNESLGYLKNREDDKTYQMLAQQLWFTAVFWPKQCRVRGIPDRIEDLRESLWSQINPHLTPDGEDFIEQTKVGVGRIS